MDTITERTDSLVGSFAIFDGWGLQFTIFCLALLFVFGTQVLFLFPRQRTWITYAIRVVGGAVPVTVFLFFIAAVYSRSGSISYVTFFQISNIVIAFLGLVAGGVLAYFAGRYFEPFVIEILNKRTRIVDPTYQRTEFVQTILDTTPIKWLYRPSDKDTASWISNQTGRILVSTQRSNTVRNLELSESFSASRSVGETERNLYDVNTIMSLPKGCAVCLGTDLPQLAIATALPVQKVGIYPEPAKLATGESIDLLERIPKSANSEIHDESKHMPLFDRIPKDRLLYFLYEETWTHIDIIFQLLNDVSNEQIEAILKEQSEAKLIRNHQFPTGFSSTEQIWGIAKRGVSLIQETDRNLESRPVFYKTSVNRTSLNRQLDIQRLRLIAERKGWRDWKKSERNSVKKKGEVYPDVVAVRPDLSRIAIEVERTIKAYDRYPGVLVAHWIARKNRKWDEIYYFSSDTKVSRQLEKIFSEISEANHLGEVLKINDAHRAPFRFLAYDDDWT